MLFDSVPLISLQCLGTTGTVVGIDEDHDIVVSYPSGNRSAQYHSRKNRVDLIKKLYLSR